MRLVFLKILRFGLIRSLRAIRDIKKGDEVKGRARFVAINTIFPAAGQLLHDCGKVARVVQTGRSHLHFLLFDRLFRFGFSGCGRQRKTTQLSKGEDTQTLIRLMSSCQVHRPSVWAARLPDSPARVRGAQCPWTRRSRPGECAGRVPDRGGTKRRGGTQILQGQGRGQTRWRRENSKSSKVWGDHWLILKRRRF